MKRVKYYIAAFRLRTLPLSISGILLGSLLAASAGSFNWLTFVLAIFTTLSLQILSNISNELGDSLKGTDTDDRQGPIYGLFAGTLSRRDFYAMITLFVVLSAIFGLWLLYVSFDVFFSFDGMLMLLFGGLAIVAALTYTLGKKPYGYVGLGDIFVFIFFGLLSTVGSYFLMTGRIDRMVFLPASAAGFLITGVLNINNIRDRETDVKTRITIPVMLGDRKAKIYHDCLIIGAFIAMLIFNFFKGAEIQEYLFLLLLPLFIKHLIQVKKLSGKPLDKQMPVLVLLTLFFVLVVSVGWFL